MIINYSSDNMEPYILKGAKIKVIKLDNLAKKANSIMIKNKASKNYIFGEVVSYNADAVKIKRREKDFSSRKIITIARDAIEEIFEIVYIKIDLQKCKEYYEKKVMSLGK